MRRKKFGWPRSESPPDEGRPPQPWLAQVLRNVIRSSARRTRAERVREKAEGALREQQAPPAEGVLQRMETQRVVAEQVMALAEPYRSTLLLRFYEGRPAADIARAQGIPAGTVRWRINEGLRRLREELDQKSGGQRTRWTRALAPLASLPASRQALTLAGLLSSGLTLKVAGVGVITVLVFAVLWLRGAHTSGGSGHGPLGSLSASAQGGGDETEEAKRKKEKLKRAAVLFGVVVPALASAAGEVALEDAIINGCLEMQQRSFECKDAFVDAILELQLEKTGGSLTPAQRAQVREVRLQVADKGMAVPLEQRREGCKSFVDQLEPPTRNVAYWKTRPLNACYAEQNCNARVQCMVAVLKEVGTELGASTN